MIDYIEIDKVFIITKKKRLIIPHIMTVTRTMELIHNDEEVLSEFDSERVRTRCETEKRRERESERAEKKEK